MLLTTPLRKRAFSSHELNTIFYEMLVFSFHQMHILHLWFQKVFFGLGKLKQTGTKCSKGVHWFSLTSLEEAKKKRNPVDCLRRLETLLNELTETYNIIYFLNLK